MQLSFFDSEFHLFYEQWNSSIRLPHDEPDIHCMNIPVSGDSCSVFLYGRVFFKLFKRKSGLQLHVASFLYALPNVPPPSFGIPIRVVTKSGTEDPEWHIYTLDSFFDTSAFFSWSLLAKKALFRTLGDVSFACCNDFERCSDAMSCLHPYDIFYNHCLYRTNLEAGRIFYGKNKNI